MPSAGWRHHTRHGQRGPLARAGTLLWAVALLAAPCDAYFRGDPVQTFKRMQYMGKRSVWSDVLVGQGPLFGVDRAVELNYPSSEVPSQDTLKMQLSYDNEKFTSEWITLSDGRGHQLDLITAVFVFSGSEIHDVQHRLTYKKLTADDAPGHRDAVTIAYHWVREVEEDTRSALNFLFVAGCLLSALAVLAVAMDSSDLSSERALCVPEYFDAAAKCPKVKQFVLFERGDADDDTDGEGRVIGVSGRGEQGLGDSAGLRGRAGGRAGGSVDETEGSQGALKSDGKGD